MADELTVQHHQVGIQACKAQAQWHDWHRTRKNHARKAYSDALMSLCKLDPTFDCQVNHAST